MIKFLKATNAYSSTKAIDDISLDISENKIYCLLVRNSEGKTAFLKRISGHILHYLEIKSVC